MDLTGFQKPPRFCRLNRVHPFARGLIGAWVMNEGTGGLVWDYSGNGNYGTNTDSPAWVAGDRGHAIDYSGTNARTSVANSPMLDGMTELTLSMRFYMASSVSADQGLFYKAALHQAGQPLMIWADNAATDHYAFLITDAAGHTTGGKYSSAVPSIGWVTLDLVFRGDVNTRLYINGVEDANSPFAHASVSDVAATADDITIGKDPQFIRDFDGLFSHVMMWDVAHTEDQVKRRLNRPYQMFAPTAGLPISVSDTVVGPPAPVRFRAVTPRTLAAAATDRVRFRDVTERTGYDAVA